MYVLVSAVSNVTRHVFASCNSLMSVSPENPPAANVVFVAAAGDDPEAGIWKKGTAFGVRCAFNVYNLTPQTPSYRTSRSHVPSTRTWEFVRVAIGEVR